jgi:hypothetical protein
MAVQNYGPVFAELLQERRLMPLGPGSPNSAVRPRLEQVTVEKAFAHSNVRNGDMAACCLAGLWLYHDFLDESHRISQEIDTTSGSYWHGIMHRREPDYGNSKYWFRRVGNHPVFSSLGQAAAEIAAEANKPATTVLKYQSSWDPFSFIDLIEASEADRDGCGGVCQQVQQREWELLFDHCYRQAVGQS